MLEKIREGSQGPWAMVIIGLVVLSFVFAGVGSYLTSSGGTAAATVNGEEISQQTLERAYQNQRARMEAQYGEGISSLFASEGYTEQFRQSVLERLIGEKLIEQKAKELGLRVSDKQIRDSILKMPEFQVGGTFNNERFQGILRQNGFKPADFRNYLRVELTREQLTRALTATSFTLPSEAEQTFLLQQQTRDARYLQIEAAPFAKDVEVSEDDINNYYQANITAFDTEEQVKLAYVLLSVDELKQDVSVSEDEISNWYEENKGRFVAEEQRRVSHILIEFGEDQDKAKQEAQNLLAQIKSGEDFAALAKQHSDDTFSAENGGDLDFISADMMDPAFDKAAFDLKEAGDVSDVVESDFGYHIIKLTELKPEAVTPLEEVRETIKEQLATDKATERFFELQNRMAEVAFEMPDSLEEVANVAATNVQTTELFTRNTAPAQFNTPNAIEVAFSDELIQDRVNSDIIELDDSTVAFFRVVAHEPQRTQELAEVREGIEATLRDQKAQKAAEAWALDVAEKLNAEEDVSAMLNEQNVEWQTAEGVSRQGGQLARNMVDTLFSLSMEGKRRDVTLLTSGNVGLVELTKVNHADKPDSATLATFRQRLATMESQQTYQSFVDALRADAEVSINKI
ncbi:SurA N-terminal domain-containing protein [Alteromonas ponticola]|uniref:Periplasmic chaperone PpiD n=1 Tax=Alteromonas aquimaris TaxID=2998417 RepID=A0ABT3P3J4_9ALTE|nr:SurA N-terminal domain-containing protein [Alteromonas aquimaris]MCW8107349.1 SurA N-terminal domain-containing protein [Alteromonas aquimaris]